MKEGKDQDPSPQGAESLLPCPFCGDAMLGAPGQGYLGDAVGHSLGNSKCFLSGLLIPLAGWNRRAPQSGLPLPEAKPEGSECKHPTPSIFLGPNGLTCAKCQGIIFDRPRGEAPEPSTGEALSADEAVRATIRNLDRQKAVGATLSPSLHVGGDMQTKEAFPLHGDSEANRVVDGLLAAQHRKHDATTPIAGASSREVERLRKALESIANNSCCETCQEAKLVAKAALQAPASKTPAPQDILRQVMTQREEISKAFLAKYGCQPDEVEQVEQLTESGRHWYLRFKRKTPAPRPLGEGDIARFLGEGDWTVRIKNGHIDQIQTADPAPDPQAHKEEG